MRAVGRIRDQGPESPFFSVAGRQLTRHLLCHFKVSIGCTDECVRVCSTEIRSGLISRAAIALLVDCIVALAVCNSQSVVLQHLQVRCAACRIVIITVIIAHEPRISLDRARLHPWMCS